MRPKNSSYKNRVPDSLREEKETFWSCVLAFVGVLGFIIWALVTPNEDPFYPKVHQGLFSVCLIVIIGFLISMRAIPPLLMLFIQSLRGEAKLQTDDKGFLFLMGSYVLALAAVAFVLDIRFMKSYGARLSATAIVIIITVVIELIKANVRRRKGR